MPKLKTNRGAAKRFSFTATGKIKKAHSFKSHILTKKSTKRKRHLRNGSLVDKANIGSMKQLLPNH